MRIQTFSASALMLAGAGGTGRDIASAPAATFNADAEGYGWLWIFPSSSAQYISPGKDELEPNHFAGGGANGGYIGFPRSIQRLFFSVHRRALSATGRDYFGGRLRYTESDRSCRLRRWRRRSGRGAGQQWPCTAVPASGQPRQRLDFIQRCAERHWLALRPAGRSPGSAADFRQALGNVSALYLRGDYIAGVVETTALDNVAITPVPEPETRAMLLAGLGLVRACRTPASALTPIGTSWARPAERSAGRVVLHLRRVAMAPVCAACYPLWSKCTN